MREDASDRFAAGGATDTASVGDASSPGRPLGELLRAMTSESATVRERAWAECHERYRAVVWTRVFYVVRTISWLPEPREMAEDVTSDVFVGLPDAAKHYRDVGRAEYWLKQVAVRTALRAKERLTGDWASGRPAGDAPRGGRSHVSFDEMADSIVNQLDDIRTEELMELERRIEAMRHGAVARHREWAEFIDLYRAGFGFAEIGARLGLTEGTARNWLVAIRKHLAAPVTRDDDA